MLTLKEPLRHTEFAFALKPKNSKQNYFISYMLNKHKQLDLSVLPIICAFGLKLKKA